VGKNAADALPSSEKGKNGEGGGEEGVLGPFFPSGQAEKDGLDPRGGRSGGEKSTRVKEMPRKKKEMVPELPQAAQGGTSKGGGSPSGGLRSGRSKGKTQGSGPGRKKKRGNPLIQGKKTVNVHSKPG